MNDPAIHEDRDMALLKTAAGQLMEHFDTVQIFVTRQNEGAEGTVNANWGAGNWFARYGQVRGWLIYQDGTLVPQEE